MKHLRIKTVAIIIAILTCGIFIVSCRGGSGKMAAKLIEEYGGKLIKKGEETNVLKYSEDIARKVKFATVTCPQCNETGKYLYATCSECNGDGKKLKVEFK